MASMDLSRVDHERLTSWLSRMKGLDFWMRLDDQWCVLLYDCIQHIWKDGKRYGGRDRWMDG